MKRIIFVGLYEEELDKILEAMENFCREGDATLDWLWKLRKEKIEG